MKLKEGKSWDCRLDKKVELNKSDRYFSWLPITKSRIKKYPYMGVATMALGAIIFLVSGGANSIN